MDNPVVFPIDQRFAQLIRQFGLTKNSFAMSLGKTASVIQHLIDGRNKPGYDLLCKVFEIYPNVSRDWLLLGRGPMLVSRGLVPKSEVPVLIPTAEQPLEPIDMSDIEVPPHRRAGPGVAGTRLQPTEIAATLALAAAATQQVRTTSPASVPPPAGQLPAVSNEFHLKVAAVAIPAVPEPLPVPLGILKVPVVSAPQVAVAALTPVIAPAPAPAATAVSAPTAIPETSVAAALNAQYFQHQLALAELRNQHLQEQQLMLREMLAMARQAMA